jgi:hypothetical protein
MFMYVSCFLTNELENLVPKSLTETNDVNMTYHSRKNRWLIILVLF